MRSILIVLLIFLQSSSLFSQVWCPPGANWNYWFFGNHFGYYKFEYTGDTIISGHNCQKIEGTRHEFWIQPPGTWWLQGNITAGHNYYTYVSGDTVYYQSPTNGNFYVMYNFGAQIGDSWITDENLVPVDSICDSAGVSNVVDTGLTIVNGTQLRTITLESDTLSSKGFDGIAYERIGAIFGHQPFIVPVVRYCTSAHADGEDYQLHCYSDSLLGDINIDTTKDCEYFGLVASIKIEESENIKIFPNPTSDFLRIVNPTKKHLLISAYSMDGKMLLEESTREYENILNISGFAAGIYQLRILSKNGIIFRKIIIN